MSEFALSLLLAVAQAAAPAESPAAARGKRIEARMTAGGVLKDGVITWEGRMYTVRPTDGNAWELCEAYDGICFRVIEEGFSKQVVMAVNDGGGILAVIIVEWELFEKERGQDAKAWFIRQGVDQKDIPVLRDPRGALIFDAWGRLTPQGQLAWQRALFGVGKTWTTEAPAAAVEPAKRKGRTEVAAPSRKKKEGASRCKPAAVQAGVPTVSGDSVKAAKAVKALMTAGFQEVSGDERCCIHTIPFTDMEINLRVVVDRGRERYFLPRSEPALAVAAKVREEGVCNPRGSSMFGK